MNRPLQLLKVLALLILALLALPHSAPEASQPEDTILVRMPASDYERLRLNALPAIRQASERAIDYGSHVWLELAAGERAIGYGSFVWLELAASELKGLQATGLPIEVRDEPYTMRLGEQSFDPLRDGIQLPAGWDALPADGPDLYLVQFMGPPREAWLEGLRRSGLEIVQYIPPFTYVVWGERGAAQRAISAQVRWTGPFSPAYRVQPRWRNLDGNPVLVDILLVRAADVEGALAQLEALGGYRHGRAVLNDAFEIATLTLPGSALQEAARVPGVYSIQLEALDGGPRGELGNQVTANHVNSTNLAYPGYLAWLGEIGLDGGGVTMANVDLGVQDDHPDLANRLVPCTGRTCGGSATDYHGTHTAGIMAADGSSGVTDSAGFLRGLGMAPAASLVEQVSEPFYLEPGGMLLLMAESHDNSAALSSNSWGPASTPQGYDNDTMQVDIGVRDADPDAPGNQPLTYVLSIMNGYGGVQTQGSPDEAKNILTVGSTRLQTSSGSQILAIDDLSANTAHGPALDGRTIPHMVAPGCSVDSTLPTSTHGTLCGTSMAAPQAAGAAALFIQRYRDLSGGLDPSPALIKAAFLPVAHDLAGNLDADGYLLGHPFDSKQGWGRLDAAAVLDPEVPVVYYDQQVLLDDTGELWSLKIAVADPSRPVRLMLVWTDAPGHGLGGTTPAWNNDLDLAVEVDGSTYHGNDFGPDGWSQAGGSADYMNNTEGVFLGPGTAVSMTVQVVASNINSDGVPGVGDDTDQDFALVCYNCSDEPDYTLAVQPSALELCISDVATATIHVGQILDYTTDVALEVVALTPAVAAKIEPATLSPPGEAVLTLSTGDGASAGDYTLVISGTAEADNVHTAAVDLSIGTELPTAPTLLSPVDGATDQAYEYPAFGWEDLPQAASYGLQVSQTPIFGELAIDAADLPANTYTHDTPLEPATCYFWRVRGQNGCGSGEWSTPSRFATVASLPASAPPTISGVQPDAGSPEIPTTILISGESFRPTVAAMLNDNLLSNVTYIDDRTLTGVVPAGLTPGSYDLTVINGDCQSATLSNAYTVDPSDQWYLFYLPLIRR